MDFLLELFLVMFIGVFPWFMGSYFLSFYKRPRLSGVEEIIRDWIPAIATLLTVVYVALNQPDGISTIGLSRDKSQNSQAGFVGFMYMTGALWLYIIGNKIYQKVKPRPEQPIDVTLPQVERIILHKNIWERLTYLVVLAELVIAEDLVFRGYLVLLCGTITGSFFPWIILSICFSVFVHLYQGRKISYIIFHAVSAAFLIGLTILTRNIFSTIVAHLFYDILVTVGVWRRTDKQLGKPEKGWEISWQDKVFYAAFIVLNFGIFLYGINLLQE